MNFQPNVICYTWREWEAFEKLDKYLDNHLECLFTPDYLFGWCGLWDLALDFIYHHSGDPNENYPEYFLRGKKIMPSLDVNAMIQDFQDCGKISPMDSACDSIEGFLSDYDCDDFSWEPSWLNLTQLERAVDFFTGINTPIRWLWKGWGPHRRNMPVFGRWVLERAAAQFDAASGPSFAVYEPITSSYIALDAEFWAEVKKYAN